MNPIYDTNGSPVLSTASSHQQRDTSISATTKAIDQLACQFMANLNERSTAFANGANFDLALRDAAFMRYLNPTSSLGYLKAGNIYQQQGRHQQAVSMYEEGLAMVPSSDDCYADLQKSHVDAVNATDKRTDFISQLPFEIVASAIFPLLFHGYKLKANTRCPYLYVSRAWRQRILQCNSLSFHFASRNIPHPFELRELERFAEHFATLSIDAGTADTYDDPLFIFEEWDFANLTSLSIRYYGYDDDDILSALDLVPWNLSHLDLYTEDDNTSGIHLGGILDLCPNLVSLKLTTMTTHNLKMQYPKLTHLTLNLGYEPLPRDTIPNMLSHLPSLVFFDLFHVPKFRFLARICGHCPGIKVLKCGGHHTFHHDNYDRHVDGLQKLSFGFSDVDEPYFDGYVVYNGEDLVPLLLQNHQSLDHIILGGRLMGQSITLDNGTLDSSWEFDRLEEFEIDAVNDTFATLAALIIHRSPRLHRVKIGNHVAANQVRISNAVKELKELHVLSARNLGRDSTWFCDILEHHVQLGMDSPLKELKIAVGPGVWICRGAFRDVGHFRK